MTAPWLGCIADDYTGATDLASMLVRAGLRVIQCFDVPNESRQFVDVDAIVVSLKSRSVPAEKAVQWSMKALRFLESMDIKRFFFKYCSTFDSTPAGNIGPVAEALARALDATEVIFCPAFPENGRTVYCGHLFVGGVPLHESGMRNHPLNPMLDSNLVRVLQAQSNRSVDLLSLSATLSPVDLPGQLPRHLIADAINDGDLKRIAKLARNHRLVTGGSAISKYWAEELRSEINPSEIMPIIHESIAGENAACGSRTVVLAGSCSDTTRTQIAEFGTQFPVFHLALKTKKTEDEAIAAINWCDQIWSTDETCDSPVLICSGASSEAITSVLQRFGGQNAANLVEQSFGLIARRLIDRGVRRIVVAGGETSGAVINALNIKAVRIGQEIAPGVPWIQTLEKPLISLVLKSGNFGGPRFFIEALKGQS